MAPRSTSILPRWLSIGVGASAAIASVLVALSGYGLAAPGLAPALDPIFGGPPPWVQSQGLEFREQR